MKISSVKIKNTGLVIIVVSILFVFSIYNQPYYPVTWFDEGFVLQGAINLVDSGQYAMRSVEGFRVLDQPLTANGPGIVLPISIVFRFFGVGLLQARILMAIYLVFAIILFYRVAKSLSGGTAALISTLMLLAVPDEGLLLYGRQVLGNVPALLYFLIGIYFFILLVENKNNSAAFFAGISWGVTLITKSQYWIVIPVFVAILLLDLIYYKQIGIKAGLIMITSAVSCLVLWQFLQYIIIGSDGYGAYVESIRSSARVTVFAFRAMRIPGSLWYLTRSGFLLFVGLGISASVINGFRRHAYSVVHAFLILLIMAWTIWYVFVSVGWSRYTFEPYSIGLIFFGLFCVKAYEYVFSASDDLNGSWSLYAKKIIIGIPLVLTLIWGIRGGLGQFSRIMFPPEPDPQKFAEYLRNNLPSDVVVESWEWELDVLTPDLTYHHPTNDWVDRKTAEVQFGEMSNKSYDIFASSPTYLIDGPFSKMTGMYKEALSEGCCAPVVNMGQYTLYKVIPR